jgi:hypothetical protein
MRHGKASFSSICGRGGALIDNLDPMTGNSPSIESNLAIAMRRKGYKVL